MTPDRTEQLNRLDHLINDWAWHERQGFLDVVRPFSLTLSQYAVMSVLERAPDPMSLSEICDLTLTPPSSMTHTIDRLVERGLIARSPHPTDRRTILVSLTEQGEELTDQIQFRRRAHMDRVFEPLDDNDLAAFTAIFEKFVPARSTPHAPARNNAAARK